MQADYWRKQLDTLAAQAEEVRISSGREIGALATLNCVAAPAMKLPSAPTNAMRNWCDHLRPWGNAGANR
jgi:hypothetical protein